MERDVEAIVRANSRTPDVVLGDIRGQVGVGRLGERRLAETIARYGREMLLATFAELQDLAETSVRRALAGWPDGTHEGQTFLDAGEDGKAVRFHVRIEKRGDRIHFDFSGSDDQSPGPLNIRPPLVKGACAFALLAMTDPTIPNNGGLERAIDFTLRRGSSLDPVFPAATKTYMPTANAIAEACLQALGGFVPERRVAGNSGGAGLSIGGRRADRLLPAVRADRRGGRPALGGDGPSGISVLLGNIEVRRWKCRVREFATRRLLRG